MAYNVDIFVSYIYLNANTFNCRIFYLKINYSCSCYKVGNFLVIVASILLKK